MKTRPSKRRTTNRPATVRSPHRPASLGALIIGMWIVGTGLVASCGSFSNLDDTCAADDDCSAGLICDTESGRCVAEDVPSTSDAAETTDTDTDVQIDPCASCAHDELCCASESAESGLACLRAGTENCGGCGVSCHASQSCAGSACVCRVGLGDCDDATPGCESDLLSDDGNCGACGVTCGTGAECVGGRCLCGDVTCAPGQSCCNDECVDLEVRADNCGACGVACQPGEVCDAGVCSCPGGDPCAEGERCCGGFCADIATGCACGGNVCSNEDLCCSNSCTAVDRNNCGACGVICRPDQICEGSACTCPGGERECVVDGDVVCADTDTDVAHCGGCGIACGTGEVCCGGTCQQGLPGSCSWWDPAWLYRTRLGIETDVDLAAGYPVMVELDHAALVAASKSLDDGADLRVACYDQAQSAWVERERVIEPLRGWGWNQTTTRVWFRLPNDVTAGVADASCAVYYGNGTAQDPGVPWNAVFIAGDDMRDLALSPGLEARTDGLGAEIVLNDDGNFEFDVSVQSFNNAQASMLTTSSPLPSDRRFALAIETSTDLSSNSARVHHASLVQTAVTPWFGDDDDIAAVSRFGVIERRGDFVFAEYYAAPTHDQYLWSNSNGPWGLASGFGGQSDYPSTAQARYRTDIESDGTEVRVRVAELVAGNWAQPLEPDAVPWGDITDDGNDVYFLAGEPSQQRYRVEFIVHGVMVREFVGTDATVSLGSEETRQ